jgi:hypothetical protein
VVKTCPATPNEPLAIKPELETNPLELITTPATLTEVIAVAFVVIAVTRTLALLASLARSFVNVDI